MTWLFDVCFFSGTISLFHLIKGRRQLKENKPPPLSLISSSAAQPASSLVLKVSKDFYLSRWWSRGPAGSNAGFVNPSLSPARGFIFIPTDPTPHTNTKILERARTQVHKYLSGKTTGNHFYSKTHIHVRTSWHTCTNTEAAIIWGMLNIYLSWLLGQLHQSAASLGLSINLTFKDSSLLGSYSASETKCKHLHCGLLLSTLLFSILFVPTVWGNTVYRCLSVKAGLWKGNKHLNM